MLMGWSDSGLPPSGDAIFAEAMPVMMSRMPSETSRFDLICWSKSDSSLGDGL